MNAKSSGFISGAASGAAVGTEILPGWGTAIGAVGGGVLGLVSGGNTDASQENSQAWAGYSNAVQHETGLANLEMQSMISMANGSMALASAAARADSTRAVAGRNAELIRLSTDYNASLLDEEEKLLWESAGLDIEQLEMQRARERGNIVAAQAASGTVIGTGSNKDIVIAQKTMEAFDAFVLRHNAEVGAAKIEDAKALGLWQGEVAARQTEWQGNLAAVMESAGANMRVAGMIAQTGMNVTVGRRSVDDQFMMGQYGMQQNSAAYSDVNRQNMINGLFSAGSKVAAGYAGNFTPTGSSTAGNFAPAPSADNWQPYSTQPGGSLMAVT